MGLPSSPGAPAPGTPADAPDDPLPFRLEHRFVFPPQPPTAWQRWGRGATLFVVTACSIFLAGALDVGELPDGRAILTFEPGEGTALALGLLAILVAHEMGHYLACRYYGVDATLPHFIPAPWIPIAGLAIWQPISFVGTFGAFIRIRSPIPNRRALFDIGAAGPLAGFVVCLPVLVLGVLLGRVGPSPQQPVPIGGEFGEPLIFQWVTRAIHGPIPAGSDLYITKLGIAAWFGLLVTALNLMPIGQLDGGHVVYAILRRKAHLVSRVGSWVCVGLIYFSPSWILWAVLVRVLGRRHPPTLDDKEPLGRGRVWVGVLSLAVFVVCFVPNPIVVHWHQFFEQMGLSRLVR